MTQAQDNVLLGITVNQVGSGETIAVKVGMTSNTEYEHKETCLTTVLLHVFNVVLVHLFQMFLIIKIDNVE